MPDRSDQIWADSELVMISALEHYSYCPRQCALIHLEQTFDENLYTIRGQLLHERVDEPASELHGEVRIERALPLWSKRLGLVGKADVVEFHPTPGSGRELKPYPVEYKVGPRRKWGHDDLQLCAQAICLEEMTGQSVPCGAVYHHGSRKRREVVFDEPLRQRVIETVAAVRQMLATETLPPAVNDARCEHCSLKESCLPKVVGEAARLQAIRLSLFRANDST
ncbi:MAG: CRISPR-associated protein Cas4 [Acidobacteriota bacterium]|nr:CRISPR-associated protein Cas4 [Blastocatellia bacterium]MDW8241103.1 CRISPR-associated protein Cas4 [Acidobacteriota bacterium]